jgi:hypothetical protein
MLSLLLLPLSEAQTPIMSSRSHRHNLQHHLRPILQGFVEPDDTDEFDTGSREKRDIQGNDVTVDNRAKRITLNHEHLGGHRLKTGQKPSAKKLQPGNQFDPIPRHFRVEPDPDPPKDDSWEPDDDDDWDPYGKKTNPLAEAEEEGQFWALILPLSSLAVVVVLGIWYLYQTSSSTPAILPSETPLLDPSGYF